MKSTPRRTAAPVDPPDTVAPQSAASSSRSPQAARSRPRSSQTTVSMNWDDADALSPHPSMKFEMAECIETKTITTTTTTKRSYPPMFVRESRALASLDSKEYPLAQRPIPPELAHFTLDLEQYDALPWPVDRDLDMQDPDVRAFPPLQLFFCTNQFSFSLSTLALQVMNPARRPSPTPTSMSPMCATAHPGPHQIHRFAKLRRWPSAPTCLPDLPRSRARLTSPDPTAPTCPTPFQIGSGES